jgi:hypothetical protein
MLEILFFYLFIIIINTIPIRNRRDVCYKYIQASIK